MSFRQKLTEMLKLAEVIKQMDLTDTYRTHHPNTKEYTFSTPHRTFSNSDYILTKEVLGQW
jgi:exonuclease III